MKNRSILPTIGIISYLILSIVDKFIISVPWYIYIGIGIFSIILIILGIIKDRKKSKENS